MHSVCMCARVCMCLCMHVCLCAHMCLVCICARVCESQSWAHISTSSKMETLLYLIWDAWGCVLKLGLDSLTFQNCFLLTCGETNRRASLWCQGSGSCFTLVVTHDWWRQLQGTGMWRYSQHCGTSLVTACVSGLGEFGRALCVCFWVLAHKGCHVQFTHLRELWITSKVTGLMIDRWPCVWKYNALVILQIPLRFLLLIY